MATLSAFLATARYEVQNMVIIDGDSRRMPQLGSVLVPPLNDVRRAMEEIDCFALLRESNCDAVYGYGVLASTEVVLGKEDSIIGFLSYS